MTNKEFIRENLMRGRTIWRFTPSASISYTRVNGGVWRVRHGLNSCTDKKISFIAAVDQLARNFAQIDNIK